MCMIAENRKALGCGTEGSLFEGLLEEGVCTKSVGCGTYLSSTNIL